MERKIGEIFEYEGNWYQCVVAIQGCRECSFRTQDYCTRHSECLLAARSDGISVIFKKLEKVGEPYSDYCPSGRVIYFQKYKCYQKPIYTGDIVYWADDIHISLEIKQTKEEMEEKKQKLDDLVGLYTSAKITYKEFDEKLKTLYADKEKCKEFDLEAAKSGKPVCTRDGRKVRIICFDRISGDDYYKIVACVTAFDGDFEEVLFYGIDGYIVDSQNPKGEDLMMLPEKKEGWVNIYALNTCYSSKEEAEANIDRDYEHEYVRTVKIEWEE